MSNKTKVPMPPPGLCVWPKKSVRYRIVEYVIDGASYYNKERFDYCIYEWEEYVEFDLYEASSILYRIWMDILRCRHKALEKIAKLYNAQPMWFGGGPMRRDKVLNAAYEKGIARVEEAEENAEICRKMGEG